MLPARRFAPLALVSPPSRRAPEPEYLNRPGIISESTRAGSYGTHALRHPLHGSGTASGATWATFGTGCVLLSYYFRATSGGSPPQSSSRGTRRRQPSSTSSGGGGHSSLRRVSPFFSSALRHRREVRPRPVYGRSRCPRCQPCALRAGGSLLRPPRQRAAFFGTGGKVAPPGPAPVVQDIRI